jgi:Ca2+-binding EF-hand superfamily protein
MAGTADRVRAVFRKFDTDNNGKLSVRELKAALKQLGVETSADEAAAILRRYDSDHSHSLDIDEFTRLHDQLLAYERSHSTAAPGSSAAAAAPPPPGGPVSDDVRAAFAHFDKDSNGRISSRELRSALTRLGIEASSHEAGAILRKFDADGSGALELDEFAALYLPISPLHFAYLSPISP